MDYAQILALILRIASEYGLPEYFVLAIAQIENHSLNPSAISQPNRNGTVDRGVMQLNSRYFSDIDWECPETNIRAACELIKELLKNPLITTFWSAAICYNAGTSWLVNATSPPASSLIYADRVVQRWSELERNILVVIPQRYKY